MPTYIYSLKGWPRFTWQHEEILLPLSSVSRRQGRLLGKLEGLGFRLREEATLDMLTLEVIKSSEIEGERLPIEQVRSSIARKLGIEIAGVPKIDRHVEGVVEMMLDATQNYNNKLTVDRLFGWHTSLFPGGRSGHKIKVGSWRDDKRGPMQVVSGTIGREKVHFEAPAAAKLPDQMQKFLKWFNTESMDAILKAGVAHLWFVTVHPFADGNGRVARAIADLQLARADGSKQRFYSMSAQIQKERNEYYSILEKTQKGTLDITQWLLWFLQCLERSIITSEENLSSIIQKAKFWEEHKHVALNGRQVKILNRVLDGFNGKLTSSKWAIIAKCSPDTALRDITYLIEKGILEKEEGGGRSTSYRIRGL